MEIYCLPEFKKVYERLLRNNSYSDLTQGIIDSFHEKQFSDCIAGRPLNQSSICPYLKRDIVGRGGYRLYYIALKKTETIYWGFVHPKTGSEGSSNTKDEYRGELIKTILSSIQNNDLLKVTISETEIKFEQKD